MIKIGLTGGIGSGKSYIAELFKALSIPVYNSDIRGKYLMENNKTVKLQLIENFGEQAFNTKGLNREYLAKEVFTNKEKLNIINGIVHPAVRTDFKAWCKQNENAKYIIQEAAILIESGSYKLLDHLIVVIAPIQTRIDRVVRRDNMTPEMISQRISKQLSDEERIKHAKFVINNDGIMLVEEEVNKIHNELLKLC